MQFVLRYAFIFLCMLLTAHNQSNPAEVFAQVGGLVAHDLDANASLTALTTGLAEWLGRGDRAERIAAGHMATPVLVDGDVFGPPRDAALKAVTLWSAEILGVDDQLGSLTAGKRASLIVTSGDPLEVMTKIERVWIDGEEYDFDRSKHRQLYERYKARIEAGAD